MVTDAKSGNSWLPSGVQSNGFGQRLRTSGSANFSVHVLARQFAPNSLWGKQGVDVGKRKENGQICVQFTKVHCKRKDLRWSFSRV